MRTISKKTHGVLQLMRDNQGVAMIEFAFVAPLMAMLIVSGIELANYVQAHSRVSEIANTVADNAARVQSGVDESDITQVFAGANIIGSSIDFEDNGRVVLSSLQQNGRTGPSSGQMIEWQRCWGNLTTVAPAYGTQGKGKTDSSLPNGMGPASNQIASANGIPIMFVEVSYRYTPLFLHSVVGQKTIRYESSFTMREQGNRTITNGGGATVHTCA